MHPALLQAQALYARSPAPGRQSSRLDEAQCGLRDAPAVPLHLIELPRDLQNSALGLVTDIELVVCERISEGSSSRSVARATHRWQKQDHSIHADYHALS